MLAEEATTAGDDSGHNDAVARPQILDLRPDLHDLPHEFVPEDIRLLHHGDVATIQVQVRAADRRCGDLNDGVARVEDFRVGHGLHSDVAFAEPAQCSHHSFSSSVTPAI
jgi:hypothetical protein